MNKDIKKEFEEWIKFEVESRDSFKKSRKLNVAVYGLKSYNQILSKYNYRIKTFKKALEILKKNLPCRKA